MIREAALLTVLAATLLTPQAVAVRSAAAITPVHEGRRQTPPLVIESITPDAPKSRTTKITISATYVNTGRTPLYNLRMRLRNSPIPLSSRQEMAAYQAGQAPLRDRASLSASVQIPSVAAGAKFSHTFTVSPAQLEQFQFGVYPLAVEVVDPVGRTLAIQRTFLPYAPSTTTIKPNRLSVVLPLLDTQPRRGDDGTFTDTGLSEALSEKGRLADLLTLVKETAAEPNVTWMVDPALLDDVQALSAPHTVGTGERTGKRSADPAAAPWLDGLRTALANASIFATPYADPDVAGLVHNGLDDATSDAIAAAGETGEKLLDRQVPTDVAWPAGGLLDHDALDALAEGGVRTVLLAQANLPPAVPALVTPDAAATVSSVYGDVTALVADPVLSEVLGGDVSAPGAAVVARQRFIAETAMIATEDAPARNLVVAPPRRWHPDPAFVSDLLQTAAKLPWLSPAPLSSLKPPKTGAARAGLTYTEANRRAELPKAYLNKVKRTSAQADLTAEVTADDDDSQPFTRSVLRLTSSAWRGKTDVAQSVVERVDTVIARHIARVGVTGAEQPRTLAGADGVVPISVHNALDKTVAIRVEVESTDRRKLQVRPYDPAVLIGPQQSQPVQVPLSAPLSGETKIVVQLRTEQGAKYGPPVELTVRTTGYTGIALVIVGGALSVMLAAVVMRVIRRRGRRSRRAAAPVPERVGAQAKDA